MSFNAVVEDDVELKRIELLSNERKYLQSIGDVPEWYTTQSWQMFKEKVAVPGEKGAVRGRFETIATTLVKHLPEIIREKFWWKFYNLMWDGVLVPSSPVYANCGTDRGMVVSCAGQVVGDSVWSFYTNLRETAMLSKYAFGTSGDFNSIRSRGTVFGGVGKANGAEVVIDDFFTACNKISQGGIRRGSFAAYLDIESKDFDEAIGKLKKKGNGRNYGWTIRDTFIEKLKNDDPEANRRFQEALYVKLTTGKGYLFFPDKANRHRPQMYKDLGLDIKATNLCTEILLHSSEKLTFSCILSSLNLVHWDKIKHSDAVQTATIFIDCICSEFIEKSKDVLGLEKVREFTIKGRAIGLGVMGFATYLQKNMIPFESLDAMYTNTEIFKHIHDESLKASQWMAKELGEPEWCTGYGVRNTHRTTLPPTKSSSILAGNVSESVFPDPGMVFEASSSVGELPRITSVFYDLMKERGQYSKETIKSIINRVGSVQHLDWLTDHEKLVFKTAFEIDQNVIFRYAKYRQKFLCQGQSLNFYFSEDGSEDQIAELTTRVFLDPDIISQYYFYSRSGVIVKDECIACAA